MVAARYLVWCGSRMAESEEGKNESVEEIPLLCGVTVKGDVSNAGWSRLAKHRWWELETDLFFAAILRDGDTVIDVGAFEGITTVIAALLVRPSGHVHAFEPDPTLHQIAMTHLRRNELTNVTLSTNAVGSKSGSIPMRQYPTSRYAVTVFDPSLATRQAECVALDDYCSRQGIREVTLLKVDVDGPELDCLRGAQKLLSSDRPPAVVVEVSAEHAALGSSPQDVLGFLQSCGYRCFGARMKFPFVREIRSIADFEHLPVRFGKREVANLFCLKPEAHLERVVRCLWPFREPFPSYRRNYFSPEPYATPAVFWLEYQSELMDHFGQSLEAFLRRKRS